MCHIFLLNRSKVELSGGEIVDRSERLSLVASLAHGEGTILKRVESGLSANAFLFNVIKR